MQFSFKKKNNNKGNNANGKGAFQSGTGGGGGLMSAFRPSSQNPDATARTTGSAQANSAAAAFVAKVSMPQTSSSTVQHPAATAAAAASMSGFSMPMTNTKGPAPHPAAASMNFNFATPSALGFQNQSHPAAGPAPLSHPAAAGPTVPPQTQSHPASQSAAANMFQPNLNDDSDDDDLNSAFGPSAFNLSNKRNRPKPEELLEKDLRTVQKWEPVAKKTKQEKEMIQNQLNQVTVQTVGGRPRNIVNDNDENDDDPLAAFMRENNKELEKENIENLKKIESSNNRIDDSDFNVVTSDDYLDHDPVADAIERDQQRRKRQQLLAQQESSGTNTNSNANALGNLSQDSSNFVNSQDDNDDNYQDNLNSMDPASKKANIDQVSSSLPDIDHSKIKYPPFQKNFYKEHELVTALTNEQVSTIRKEQEISVFGAANSDIPKPVYSFSQFNLEDFVMSVLVRQQYETPTAIQCQGIPIVASGYDCICTAKTGSGKTLAYVLPMIQHVLAGVENYNKLTYSSDSNTDQSSDHLGNGPIALILSPTQDLSIQIENEIHRFSKREIKEGNQNLNDDNISNVGGGRLRTCTLAGGLSKHEQFKQLKKGCEIVVGSPGRVVDLIRMKGGLDLRRVTYLVLDEADRMLDMGFETQVLSIVKNTRPDRQLLMFSATFPPKVEQIAQNYLSKALRVRIGQTGNVAETIEQRVVIVGSGINSGGNTNHDKSNQNFDKEEKERLLDKEKLLWLSNNLSQIVEQGQTLIFVKSKERTDILLNTIKNQQLLKKSIIDKENLNESQANRLISSIHGDMDQVSRLEILGNFRKRKTRLLIATDVAARGLDISGIKTVICYDAANKIETHTHRIGRTGRAGQLGVAYTLLEGDSNSRDSRLAGSIYGCENVTYREEVKDENDYCSKEDLLELAMKYSPFAANWRLENGEGRGSMENQSQNKQQASSGSRLPRRAGVGFGQ